MTQNTDNQFSKELESIKIFQTEFQETTNYIENMDSGGDQ